MHNNMIMGLNWPGWIPEIYLIFVLSCPLLMLTDKSIRYLYTWADPEGNKDE